MIGFFRSVAEAVVEKGVRGLLEEVPFGRFFFDVAERVVQKERDRRRRDEQRAEFERIVGLSHEAARDEARAALAEAARERGVAVPPAELDAAAEWVAGIPEAARVSNRRPDDPDGRTLAAGFALDTPDDVLKVLPPRPPRFLAGQPVPGRGGGWLLDRVLGIGGFGEVWLARHANGFHAPRAVKFFFDQTGRDVQREADLVRRAVDAGKADTGRADDPRRHIVPILDLHLTGDPPWLMFEYVGGGNLAAWLLQLAGRPPAVRVPQVVLALQQLCRGAGVFHGLPVPVVHRDLKPSNILIDRATKKLRITDFGIGAVTQGAANARETRGETSKGERQLSYLRGAHTPTYSSPEQRTGAPPDPRDDVHALGVIAFQMLVGDLAAAPAADVTDDLRDCATPPELIQVITACVSRKRDRRPADARDLAARLDALPRAKSAAPPPPVVVVLAPPPPAPAAASATPTPGAEYRFPLPGGLEMVFCWVPAGAATLGSPFHEDGRQPNESERAFQIGGFWLGKYPVTQVEWAAVMAGADRERPSHFGPTWLEAKRGKWDTARHPVESVDVADCEAFLRRLARGRARLPTEVEWEYAARGGLGNRLAFYWGNALDGTQANADGRRPHGATARGPYLGRTRRTRGGCAT